MTVLNRRDEHGVATLTLCRPALKNALSTELLAQLQSQLDRVRDSPEVRAVILAGAGDAFCAGADLREFPPDAGDLARELAVRPRAALASVKRVLRPGSPAGLVPPPEYAWTED